MTPRREHDILSVVNNPNTLTTEELDEIIQSFPHEITGIPFETPEKWRRVDCGNIEVYVGDRKYVIALIETMPPTEQEVVDNQINAEDTITKYLENEDFLDDVYSYIGMQKFPIKPPKNSQ